MAEASNTKPIETHLDIEGMHCGGCVTRVTAALKRIPGVAVKKVQVGVAEIESPHAIPTADLAEAIQRVGFRLKNPAV